MVESKPEPGENNADERASDNVEARVFVVIVTTCGDVGCSAHWEEGDEGEIERWSGRAICSSIVT